ncbi:hypothetical protein GGI35DRAFT_139890 [Trichoderma velutinum]
MQGMVSCRPERNYIELRGTQLWHNALTLAGCAKQRKTRPRCKSRDRMCLYLCLCLSPLVAKRRAADTWRQGGLDKAMQTWCHPHKAQTDNCQHASKTRQTDKAIVSFTAPLDWSRMTSPCPGKRVPNRRGAHDKASIASRQPAWHSSSLPSKP